MLLLDTNYCFRIIARDRTLLTRLDEIPAERVATSVIVAGELLYGASISQRREENLAAVGHFIESISVIPISTAIADRYGYLKSSLLDAFGPRERAKRRHFELSKLGFNDNDLWIAATALKREATLVSADPDFTRIAAIVKLQVEDWLLPT